jgi:DNA-binding beta-propeller fold protein YncE
MRPLRAACAAAVVVLAFVAGCSGGQRGAPAAGTTARTVAAARSDSAALPGSPTSPALASPAPASPAPASPSAAPGGIFTTRFVNPSLTFTGGSLYLTWQASAQAYPPRMTLSRVDRATGAIMASNTFSPGLVSAPLSAAGWLWVTDDPASVSDLLLLRLDPRTLMVTGELSVGNHPSGSVGTGGHIAFAGGSIWVDGAGQLVRVSPGTVAAELTIPQPGADSAEVAASPDGGTLIVSEADSGAGAIQRRDPVTGTLQASYPMLGTFAPLIGGVSGAGVWVREPTGMLGYIERFQTATVTPQAGTRVEGSNGIGASVWDGALWVSDEAAGPALNYCADPATGRRLATLPLPDLGQDYLMTVAGGLIYYSAPGSDGFAIRTVPVPAACG